MPWSVPTPVQLAADYDNNLFSKLLHNNCHVLKQLLPAAESNSHYNLRQHHYQVIRRAQCLGRLARA